MRCKIECSQLLPNARCAQCGLCEGLFACTDKARLQHPIHTFPVAPFSISPSGEISFAPSVSAPHVLHVHTTKLRAGPWCCCCTIYPCESMQMSTLSSSSPDSQCSTGLSMHGVDNSTPGAYTHVHDELCQPLKSPATALVIDAASRLLTICSCFSPCGARRGRCRHTPCSLYFAAGALIGLKANRWWHVERRSRHG